jgi:hypothetical protein
MSLKFFSTDGCSCKEEKGNQKKYQQRYDMLPGFRKAGKEILV